VEERTRELWYFIRVAYHLCSGTPQNTPRYRRPGGSKRVADMMAALASVTVGRLDITGLYALLAHVCYQIVINRPFATRNKDVVLTFAPFLLEDRCGIRRRGDPAHAESTLDEFHSRLRSLLQTAQAEDRAGLARPNSSIRAIQELLEWYFPARS
jgi:hypothetical protein